MGLKSLLLNQLSPENRARLHGIRARLHGIRARYSGDLIRLGDFYKTDKWNSHWYLQHYQTHFGPLRKKRLNLLEIGVGGYADRNGGGESLRTWKWYFPKARVFGIDLHDKRNVEEERIKTFQGDQVNEEFLRRVVEEIGGVDIVIDDGSHINAHVIRTFEILFPLLRNNGVYVVEDTQTSYWPGFGGSSAELGHPQTIMGYFTSLTHAVNYEEILRDDYSPTEFDRHIVAMHFYHNLILVQKGENSEGSNVLRHNRATSPIVFEGLPDQSDDATAARG